MNRTMSFLLPCALALSLAEVALAADVPKPKMQIQLPDYQLQTLVFDFPTGLRIMFQTDHSYPIVSVYSIVNHGSADDPEGKNEVAHFVEHIWFRSEHGELPPIMDVVNDLSGFFNASTWNDWTNYSTVANSNLLPVLMRLESLRLTEFYKGVTEEEITTEREVIRNEWRRRNENNYALLFEFSNRALYPEGHPYHSFSTHDTIDSIKLADLQAYVDQYYKAENTTITVVGDFNPDEVSSLIFSNFDLSLLHPKLTPDMLFFYPKSGIDKPDANNPNHWLTGAYDPDEFLKGNKVPFQLAEKEGSEKKKPRVGPDRPAVPPLGTKEIVHEKAPIDYPIAIVAWSLPGGFREDHAELELLGNVATGTLASGLNEVYTGENQLGDVGCSTQAEVINSTLLCFAEAKDPKINLDQLTDKMLDQFAALWNPEQMGDPVLRQFTDRSMARARNEFLASTLLSLDNVASIFAGRADNIGTYAHLTNETRYFDAMFKRYGDIDLGKVTKMSYEFMKRNRAARIVVKPLKKEELDTTSAESGYVAESKSDGVVRASDNLAALTSADVAASRMAPDIRKIEDFKLANGLRVVVMPHGEAPLVGASLVVGGGSDTMAPGEADFIYGSVTGAAVDPLEVAATTNWPFYFGMTSSKSYPLLANAAWGNAIRLDWGGPGGNLDVALYTLRTEMDGLKPNLDGTLKWKKDRKEDLLGNWNKKAWHLDDINNQHLYPGAVWRNEWTWEDVQAMQSFGKSTVDKYLKHNIQPGNAILLLVGNLNTEDAKKLAETYFGNWKGYGDASQGWAGKMSPPAMPTAPTQVLIFDDEKKTQTETDMICRLNYTSEADRPAVGVLGSLMGNKTFQTLRVQEALAYSPTAFTQVSDDGSAVLRFNSLALNSGVGRTVEFFFQAAKDVEAGNVDPSEVLLHKLRTARETGIGSHSVGQMITTLSGPLRRGDDWSRIANAGTDIGAVDAAQMSKLLHGCVEHAIVTMTGPKSVIEPQLKAKGIAYEVVDWKARRNALLGKYEPKTLKKVLKADAKKEAAEKKEEAEGKKPTDE